MAAGEQGRARHCAASAWQPVTRGARPVTGVAMPDVAPRLAASVLPQAPTAGPSPTAKREAAAALKQAPVWLVMPQTVNKPTFAAKKGGAARQAASAAGGVTATASWLRLAPVRAAVRCAMASAWQRRGLTAPGRPRVENRARAVRWLGVVWSRRPRTAAAPQSVPNPACVGLCRSRWRSSGLGCPLIWPKTAAYSAGLAATAIAGARACVCKTGAATRMTVLVFAAKSEWTRTRGR